MTGNIGTVSFVSPIKIVVVVVVVGVVVVVEILSSPRGPFRSRGNKTPQTRLKNPKIEKKKLPGNSSTVHFI